MNKDQQRSRRITDNTNAMELVERAGELVGEEAIQFYDWLNLVMRKLVGSGRTVPPEILLLIRNGVADASSGTADDQRRLARWIKEDVARSKAAIGG